MLADSFRGIDSASGSVPGDRYITAIGLIKMLHMHTTHTRSHAQLCSMHTCTHMGNEIICFYGQSSHKPNSCEGMSTCIV